MSARDDETPRVPGDREIRVRAEYAAIWADDEPEPPCADCGKRRGTISGCWCAELGGCEDE